MNGPYRTFLSLLLCVVVLATGCQPTQPYFFREDGDLSHYIDVATDIEFPDIEEPSLDEVNSVLPPLTLKNVEASEIWELPLEEAVRIALCNSQVIRQLGGQILSPGPETLARTFITPGAVITTYDPAITESSDGTPTGIAAGSGRGVESALSDFDARLDASVFWDKNRRPQNRSAGAAAIFPPILAQDLGTFTSGITKTTAYGTQFSVRNNTFYEGNNVPTGAGGSRALISDWQTNFEAGFVHPLLQGAGVQYNRIAGPRDFNSYAAGVQDVLDGVVISRINSDITLADFEGGVRNLVRDLEDTYWELYFRYRDLEARKLGRDSALETWKRTVALFRTGSRGGSADREAQARSQYFLFRSQVEQALSDLYETENRLRYVLGLSMSDGRLIRPSDEPTSAHVAFEWAGIHCEALARRVEVRKQKWQIKKRELELIASRNGLLPRLDAVGTYRWLGMGDDLIAQSRTPAGFNVAGSNAFSNLTSGEFQEWRLGMQLSVPLGFRKELSKIRMHELLLARERALLQDLELEVSHQLGDSVRRLDLYYSLTQTNFNRRVAAQKEVEAVQASYEADRVTLDLLLDAQRRQAEAESAYYRSLVDYNKAIMHTHFRKGSLLDYDGVYLAEGPWPGKAYFDALRQARTRDAGTYLDYGYTRPSVFSRGPYGQGSSTDCLLGDDPAGCPAGCPLGPDDGTDVWGPEFEYGPDEMSIPDESLPSPADQSMDLNSLRRTTAVDAVVPVVYFEQSAMSEEMDSSADDFGAALSTIRPVGNASDGSSDQVFRATNNQLEVAAASTWRSTDERQANHSPAESSANSAVWQRAGR